MQERRCSRLGLFQDSQVRAVDDGTSQRAGGLANRLLRRGLGTERLDNVAERHREHALPSFIRDLERTRHPVADDISVRPRDYVPRMR